MAQPLTLYKDGEEVKNVYPSEVAHWQSQGWTLSPDKPDPKPEQPKQEPVAIVGDRQAELEAMNWREVKSVAQKLGIEKGEDQSWDDLIPLIIKKENR